MQPIILHLDMDSYFASVEQQDNSLWRGKVLGVCEHLGGIIIAASIEAKKGGIKTGTPVWEAKRIYPKIILTKTSPLRYRFYTQRLIELVSEYTDKVEVYSIDEVFLDITTCCNVKFPISNFEFPRLPKPVIQNWESQDGLSELTKLDNILSGGNGGQANNFQNPNFKIQKREVNEFLQARKYEWLKADPWEEAVKISQEIKRRMKREVGDYLTCSIGIASNKTLAKIASDLKKPDGLVVIKPSFSVIPSDRRESRNLLSMEDGWLRDPSASSLRDFGRDERRGILVIEKDDLYHLLKLTDIPGIGRRQEKNLNELGIRTLLDLKNYPKSHLIARFGCVQGHHLYHLGQLDSTWKSAVAQDEEIKSMGHMYTLPKEYRKPEFFIPVLYKLCEMVGRRLRRKKLEGNIIHFYVHDKDCQSFGGSEKLGDYISGGREIFLHAVRVFEKVKPKGEWEFKLLGVTIAHLRPQSGQLSLFGHREKTARVSGALDKINDKYGEFTVIRAPILAVGKVFRDSVGFGRVKELKKD